MHACSDKSLKQPTCTSWLLTRSQDFLSPPFKQEPQPLHERVPTNSSPQSNEGASQYPQLTLRPTSNAPYQTVNQNNTYPDNVTHIEPDYSFDNLDFLTDFPVADPGTNVWGQNHDLDAGGTAGFDGSGAWEANAELFDGSGFFFG